jgi:hypothetical protein
MQRLSERAVERVDCEHDRATRCWRSARYTSASSAPSVAACRGTNPAIWCGAARWASSSNASTARSASLIISGAPLTPETVRNGANDAAVPGGGDDGPLEPAPGRHGMDAPKDVEYAFGSSLARP